MILLLIFSCNIKALPINEVLDFRLAKAELKVVEGQYTEALKILDYNISRKYFHLESYILLADIYEKRGNIDKALRVLYYIIKKKHTAKLLNVKQLSQLNGALSNAPTPSEEILALYYRVATIYQKLHALKKFGDDFQMKLIRRAQKYYRICQYYRYNYMNASYQLSMIYRSMLDYEKSLNLLLDAKEELEDQDGREKDLQNIKYVLGDTLMRIGKRDAGFLFMQDVAYVPDGNKSIQGYAQNYLDHVNKKTIGLNFSYGQEFASNVNQLNDQLFNNFDATLFHAKTSLYTKIDTSLYYSNLITKYFSYLMAVSFQNAAHSDKVNNLDYRYYGARLELKYNNFQKSFAKFSYSFYQKDTRRNYSLNEPFKKSLGTHEVSLTYTQALSRGMIRIKLPYRLANNYQTAKINDSYTAYYFTNEQTEEYGLEISYEPYLRSEYWSPTYTFGFENIGEVKDVTGAPVADTKQMYLSLSNSITLKNSDNIFLNLRALHYPHQTDLYNYNSIDGTLYYTTYLKDFFGLVVRGKLSYFLRKYSDGNQSKGYYYGLSISKSI